MRSRKTPQENKQLSLAKDRRNNYGENDKASRKTIPFRKASVNRANRHTDRRTLSDATGAEDAEVTESAELRLRGRRRKVWRKWPDMALGDYINQRKA